MVPPERSVSSCAGVIVGQTARMSATTPAMCGDAIEVPFMNQ